MKTKKKFIIAYIVFLLSLLMIFSTSIAQESNVLKYRSYGVSSTSYVNNNWSGWSDINDQEILIVFNFVEKQVTIFAEKTTIFDIIDINNDHLLISGEYCTRFITIDKYGRTIYIDFYNPKDYYPQIYLRLPNYNICYYVKPTKS